MKLTYQNYREALEARDDYPQGSEEWNNTQARAESIAMELVKAGDKRIAAEIESDLDQLYEIRLSVTNSKELTELNLEISKLDGMLRRYGFGERADRVRELYS